MTPIFFATPLAFRKWLEKNHMKKTDLLVGFYRIDSGKPSITWPQSVDQALCFGWIDGIRKSIDEKSYTIRFTPRKPSSIWSAINIRKMEELKKSGLMMPEGEKAFGFRTENKSGIYSHENELARLGPNFTKLFKKEKEAWKYFSTQAPSYRRVMIHWIMSAKQEKTRIARLEKTILFSSQQKRVL
jgi:uncharacterized protein YdeI (YjbR/CyaY-like superfamily)